LGGHAYNIDMLKMVTEGNAVVLAVKVVPGASRTRYLGELDGRAKIAVAAAPQKGQANKALIAFLARLIGVSKRDVSIVSGHGSATKNVRIERVTAGTVRAVLSPGQS
jgi:uncharacterized protein (TIGR00251 family)